MAGFINDATLQEIMVADNVDFSGSAAPEGKVTTDGQLLVGQTSLPHIQVGSLTSPHATVRIGYSSPNITIDASELVATSLTPDQGGPVTSVANTIHVLGQTSGSAQTVQTINTANNLKVVDRTFVTEYVVDPSSTAGLQGTFTTIQGAINAAIADGRSIGRTCDILIRPGTYTETITINSESSAFNFYSFNNSGNESFNDDGVIITGNWTVTATSINLDNLIVFGDISLTINSASFTNCSILGTVTGVTGAIYLSDSVITTLTCSGATTNIYESVISTLNCGAGTSNNLENTTIVTGIVLNASGNSQLACDKCIINAITGTSSSVLSLINCTYTGIGGGINPTATINYANLICGGASVTSNPFGSNPTPKLILSSQGNLVQRTVSATNYTVLKSDYYVGASGHSGAIQFTLPDTSSAPVRPRKNQVFIFADEDGNASTNNITIATNGGTINGAASVVIGRNYESITVIFDGTNYFASSSANLTLPLAQSLGGTGSTNFSGNRTLIQSQTASSSAAISFTTGITGYDVYELEVYGVTLLGGDNNIFMRLSQDGGSTYVTAADYYLAGWDMNSNGDTGSYAQSGSTYILLEDAQSDSVTPPFIPFNVSMKLYNLGSSVFTKQLKCLAESNQATNRTTLYSCSLNQTAVVNAFQIYVNAGVMTTGTFKLYGIVN